MQKILALSFLILYTFTANAQCSVINGSNERGSVYNSVWDPVSEIYTITFTKIERSDKSVEFSLGVRLDTTIIVPIGSISCEFSRGEEFTFQTETSLREFEGIVLVSTAMAHPMFKLNDEFIRMAQSNQVIKLHVYTGEDVITVIPSKDFFRNGLKCL